jgi:hypothetical protein
MSLYRLQSDIPARFKQHFKHSLKTALKLIFNKAELFKVTIQFLMKN